MVADNHTIREKSNLFNGQYNFKEVNRMFDIIESLWRTVILLVCSFIQVFAMVFRAIGIGFNTIGKLLRKLSGKLMNALDNGKYEAEMKNICEV